MRTARAFYVRRYGGVARCVPVAAVDVVCVTGGWSLSVVDGGTGLIGLRVMFFPSTPLFGSGAAFGMPCAVGVSDDVVTGCVIAGGLFW